jgi:ribonuclease HI
MGQLNHVADALHAESIACLKAIEFAAEAGMGRIIIETDATLLKSALNLIQHAMEFSSGRQKFCYLPTS